MVSSVVQSCQTFLTPSVRVLFPTFDSPFHRVPCVMSSDLESELETLYLGASRQLQHLWWLTEGVLGGQGHCPISKELYEAVPYWQVPPDFRDKASMESIQKHVQIVQASCFTIKSLEAGVYLFPSSLRSYKWRQSWQELDCICTKQ